MKIDKKKHITSRGVIKRNPQYLKTQLDTFAKMYGGSAEEYKWDAGDDPEIFEIEGFDSKKAYMLYIGDEGAILVVLHKTEPKHVIIDYDLALTSKEDANRLKQFLEMKGYKVETNETYRGT